MWEGEEPQPQEGGPTPKQRLLNWINNKVPDLPIKNFTTDWNDGKAIGALVDAVAPGWYYVIFIITKTCLYNFDPLKPHFYTVKLGFTGVYIIFLISAQKHRLWVPVRTASPRQF